MAKLFLVIASVLALTLAASAREDVARKVLGRRLQQSANSLTVSAPSFTGQGQVVSVSWTSATTTPADQIALYIAPVSDTFSTMVPLKYQPTAGAASGTVT